MVQEQFPGTSVEHVENADRRNYRVSFEKIRNELGFQCLFTIQDGIRELKEAFERGMIVDYTDARYSNLKYLRISGPPAHRSEFDVRVMAAFSDLNGKPIGREATLERGFAEGHK